MSNIRTNDAPPAERLSQSRFSIARPRERRAGGRGIRTALSAGAPPAEITAQLPSHCATSAFAHGVGRTLTRRSAWTSAVTCGPLTASARMMLSGCMSIRMAVAPSASVRQSACSWITVTPKVTFAHCSVRPATRSLVGTKRRPIRSCAFKSIWLPTNDSGEPCHADVLLEIANR